jgi:hypothetical protein
MDRTRLILSQLLTLYKTPVMYLYLDRFRLWEKTRMPRFGNLTSGRSAQTPQLALSAGAAHSSGRVAP